LSDRRLRSVAAKVSQNTGLYLGVAIAAAKPAFYRRVSKIPGKCKQMEQRIFFIEVKPEDQIPISELLNMTFESDKDAAIALGKTEGSQNAVLYPPGDFSWYAMPPRGEVFAYPPEVHQARFIAEEGKCRWQWVKRREGSPGTPIR